MPPGVAVHPMASNKRPQVKHSQSGGRKESKFCILIN